MSDPTKAQSPALMQVSSHLPGPATSLIYRLLPSPVCCSHLLDLQELGNGERHTNALELKNMGVSGAEPWPTLCCGRLHNLVFLVSSPSMVVRRTSRQGILLLISDLPRLSQTQPHAFCGLPLTATCFFCFPCLLLGRTERHHRQVTVSTENNLVISTWILLPSN